MSLVISQSIRRAAAAALFCCCSCVSAAVCVKPAGFLSLTLLVPSLSSAARVNLLPLLLLFPYFSWQQQFSSVLFSIDWPLPAAASHSLMYSNVFSRLVSAGAAAVDGSVIISVLAFSLSPSSPSSHHVIDWQICPRCEYWLDTAVCTGRVYEERVKVRFGCCSCCCLFACFRSYWVS